MRDLDPAELNEAFAARGIASALALKIDENKLNANGDSIASVIPSVRQVRG